MRWRPFYAGCIGAFAGFVALVVAFNLFAGDGDDAVGMGLGIPFVCMIGWFVGLLVAWYWNRAHGQGHERLE